MRTSPSALSSSVNPPPPHPFPQSMAARRPMRSLATCALLLLPSSAVLEVRPLGAPKSSPPAPLRLPRLHKLHSPRHALSAAARKPMASVLDRLWGRSDPTFCFPFNVLPHWAPRPNLAAAVADAALIVVACLIFFPAFVAMRSICALSRPLDLLSTAYARRYAAWAQRARQANWRGERERREV
ncbi:hypothetical protein AB1Y20_012790 [Prymnesium parvum]|uniref:Uncharacterized protein n=1 Tax=Prymnesium parvum TaxID=97485 RepID=A0AB34ILS8_PRYPA